jgi:hypothetical protein
MTATQADKAKQFRSLHEVPEDLLSPMYGMAARQG